MWRIWSTQNHMGLRFFSSFLPPTSWNKLAVESSTPRVPTCATQHCSRCLLCNCALRPTLLKRRRGLHQVPTFPRRRRRIRPLHPLVRQHLRTTTTHTSSWDQENLRNAQVTAPSTHTKTVDSIFARTELPVPRVHALLIATVIRVATIMVRTR